MNKRIVAVAALIISLGVFTHAEVVGKSIATINGEAVFLSEFRGNWQALLDQQQRFSTGTVTTAWEHDSKKALLDQMIEEKVLLQEANRRNIVVPKRQLEEGILQVKNRFKNMPPGTKPSKEELERPLTPEEEKEFQKELKGQETTEPEFEKRIGDQLKVMRLEEEDIRGKVANPFKDAAETEDTEARELTPEYEKEVQSLYAQIEAKINNKDFKPDSTVEIDQMVMMLKSRLGEAVKASHILIRSSRTDDMKKREVARKKAQEIKAKLDQGADFDELARANSQDSSAKAGGDLGYFSRGQMVPEFEKAAFELPVGGISAPVETEFGYHIIKVDERRAAKKLRYDDIKADLAGYVYQKKLRDRYEQYVAGLRKKAEVKILVDLDKIQ